MVCSLGGSFVNGQTVIIDPINKKILVQSGEQLLGLDSLTGQTETGVLASQSATPPSKGETSETLKAPETSNPLTMELTQGSELEKAIYRMYQNGLTKYEKLSDYRPEDPLLREEAAKIIGQAYDIL